MAAVMSVVVSARMGSRSVWEEARELWQYRYLIKVLVQRELRIRYKNSLLGIGWSLVSPLVQVFVLTIAIGFFLSSGPPNLSVYIMCAFVPWTFFQTAILDASASVLAQAGLLKKVYFPREIPVIAAVCSNFVHFLISLGFFIVFRWVIYPIVFHHGHIIWPGWPPREIFWLPIIVLDEFLLILGVAFIVSASNVFYEDVKFIMTMLLQFLFYLVPIFYWAENIKATPRIHWPWNEIIYRLYLANPLAWIVTGFKQVFFYPQPLSPRGTPHPVMSAPFNYGYFALATVLSALICLGGYRFFNSRKWKFTERP